MRSKQRDKSLPIPATFITPVNADDRLYRIKDSEPSHGRYKKSI
jgi:hypothetical protein